MNWASVASLSYLRKAVADTRAAATCTVAGIDPDPAGPEVTATQRRETLLRALGVSDAGQSLAEVEALAHAALSPGEDPHQQMADLHPGAVLHNADQLGDEARQPGEPVADDPEAPEAPAYPPEEQGDEGP